MRTGSRRRRKRRKRPHRRRRIARAARPLQEHSAARGHGKVPPRRTDALSGEGVVPSYAHASPHPSDDTSMQHPQWCLSSHRYPQAWEGAGRGPSCPPRGHVAPACVWGERIRCCAGQLPWCSVAELRQWNWGSGPCACAADIEADIDFLTRQRACSQIHRRTCRRRNVSSCVATRPTVAAVAARLLAVASCSQRRRSCDCHVQPRAGGFSAQK